MKYSYNQSPKLTVVGAGPGDPDLITIKAVKALESADVVLYDALSNKALLDYMQPGAQSIFVGKRKGMYTYQQEEINALIVELALSGQHVVRLKGGDPFIFGRGAEEMEYAAERGIEVAVVPGISSSAAVPAYQDIPLTKRGVAESFWVITGTTRYRQMSEDIALAAKSSATVVILMGMSKMAQIVDLYQREGKAQTPIVIIQNGTLPQQKIGIGTIDTIQEVIAQEKLTNPAIIIIGEVVDHRAHLQALTRRVQQEAIAC